MKRSMQTLKCSACDAKLEYKEGRRAAPDVFAGSIGGELSSADLDGLGKTVVGLH